MKLKLLFSAMLVANSVLAQNNVTAPATPPGPSLPTSPGLPASPVSRGLPASPVNPGLPGFTNAFGALSMTNQFGTNFLPADLSPLLANLQTELAQLLPALAAFNDSIDFQNLAPRSTANSVSQSGVNLGGNFGANVSTTPLGINAGQNFSTVTGGSTTPTSGASISGSGGSTSNNIAANSRAGIGFSGVSRDSLRALIILQNDLQRLLPLVSALNGSVVEGIPGSFTNTVAVSTNRLFSPFPIQTTPLFPNPQP